MIMNMRPALIDLRVINFYKLRPSSRRGVTAGVQRWVPEMTRRKLKFPELRESPKLGPILKTNYAARRVDC